MYNNLFKSHAKLKTYDNDYAKGSSLLARYQNLIVTEQKCYKLSQKTLRLVNSYKSETKKYLKHKL